MPAIEQARENARRQSDPEYAKKIAHEELQRQIEKARGGITVRELKNGVYVFWGNGLNDAGWYFYMEDFIKNQNRKVLNLTFYWREVEYHQNNIHHATLVLGEEQ